jgi:hypothetical protein
MGLHRLPNGNVTEDPNDEARMTNDETMSKRVRRFRIVLALLLIIPSSTVASVKAVGQRSSLDTRLFESSTAL